MIDERESAQAEGEALPVIPQPGPLHSSTRILSRAERAVVSDAERVIAAVEAWYTQHFHRASVEGRAPISAEDKAALVAAVAKASQAKE